LWLLRKEVPGTPDAVEAPLFFFLQPIKLMLVKEGI
jgi:hypothetical protein